MPATLPAPPRATGEPQGTPKSTNSFELYLFTLLIVLGVIAAIVSFARM